MRGHRHDIVQMKSNVRLPVERQAHVRPLIRRSRCNNLCGHDAFPGNHQRLLRKAVGIDRCQNHGAQTGMNNGPARCQRICRGTRRCRDDESIRMENGKGFVPDRGSQVEKPRNGTLRNGDFIQSNGFKDGSKQG